MINRFTEVISRGETLQDLLKNMDFSILTPILERKERFRFKVEAMNRKLSMKEAKLIIDDYAQFNFEGLVDLKNPEVVFAIVENLQ